MAIGLWRWRSAKAGSFGAQHLRRMLAGGGAWPVFSLQRVAAAARWAVCRHLAFSLVLGARRERRARGRRPSRRSLSEAQWRPHERGMKCRRQE